MALTTLELLEQALGRELTGDEALTANYLIDLVSTYIETYTGIIVDDDESPGEQQSLRVKSDYYGTVTLTGGPVASVDSVKMWASQGEHPCWQWDGLNQVYGLRGNETVDITYTVGYAVVPKDIQMVATQGVKRLFDSPSGQETGPVTKYRVGDVEESYRAVDVGALGGLFNDLERTILEEYRTTETTWRLGWTQQPVLDGLPQEGDNSIVE